MLERKLDKTFVCAMATTAYEVVEYVAYDRSIIPQRDPWLNVHYELGMFGIKKIF